LTIIVVTMKLDTPTWSPSMMLVDAPPLNYFLNYSQVGLVFRTAESKP